MKESPIEKSEQLLKSILPRPLFRLVKKILLAYKIVFHKESHLVKNGFVDSCVEKSLTNKKKQFVPWMNYSMIDFLAERLNKNLMVFEFGSGASTFFFGQKTKEVISIEYDKKWYDKIKKGIPKEGQNIKINFVELNKEYPNAINKLSAAKKFDLIVIDGRYRVECAFACFDFLSDNGVVVFDDTHREKYKEGVDFFLKKGFKAITFTGLKPTDFRSYQTQILYRENNCLGI